MFSALLKTLRNQRVTQIIAKTTTPKKLFFTQIIEKKLFYDKCNFVDLSLFFFNSKE